MIILALADTHLEADEKEEILHSTPRLPVQMGKPVFPVLDWRNEILARPRLGSLVFDKLGLSGPQDWLQLPCNMWPMFSEFRKFAQFAINLLVINDLAERGIHLITEFINKSANEEQRQALLQVVEYHRSLVPDLTKKNVLKC